VITIKEKRYAIATILKLARDKGPRWWDIVVLCLIGIVLTGEDITDACINFEHPGDGWNPFVAMAEAASKDTTITQQSLCTMNVDGKGEVN
jgi:hypothetical protein